MDMPGRKCRALADTEERDDGPLAATYLDHALHLPGGFRFFPLCCTLAYLWVQRLALLRSRSKKKGLHAACDVSPGEICERLTSRFRRG